MRNKERRQNTNKAKRKLARQATRARNKDRRGSSNKAKRKQARSE